MLLDVVPQRSWKPGTPGGVVLRRKLEGVWVLKTLLGEELSERIPQYTLDCVTGQASKISGIIRYDGVAKCILTDASVKKYLSIDVLKSRSEVG